MNYRLKRHVNIAPDQFSKMCFWYAKWIITILYKQTLKRVDIEIQIGVASEKCLIINHKGEQLCYQEQSCYQNAL